MDAEPISVVEWEPVGTSVLARLDDHPDRETPPAAIAGLEP
jgi:hypothetical protein